MALKGNLRDFSLHQLLNLINLAHKTGALTVRNDLGRSEYAYLFFREGKLIYATLDHRPTRLTDMLVKVGKITPEQAKIVRDRARVDTDKELGLLLIHHGYLSQNDIIQGVRGYLVETVYHMFTWPSGEFRFEPNQLPPEERITVPLNLENLIMEGGRRQQDWAQLQDEIPDLDVPLRFAERPSTDLKSISLSVDEWKVISFINSRNTIRQIGQFLSLDEFRMRRAVRNMRQAGLIIVPQPPLFKAQSPRVPAPGARVSRSIILRIIDGIRHR